MIASMEAPSQSDVDAIVAELNAPLGVLPDKAIQAARLHREAVIPRLIGLIEDAIGAWEAGRNPAKNGHFFAFFLLAEFRAADALPVILKAISLPGEGPFELFGDAIHEALPGTLAALCGERDFELVAALIDDQALNRYVRWSAARALVAMVAAGTRTRDESVQRLRQSLRCAIDREDIDITAALVDALTDLYPEEAYEEIKEAYDKCVVESMVICLADVDQALQCARGEWLEQLGTRTRLITDTVAELRHWAAFSEPRTRKGKHHPSPAPVPSLPAAAVIPARPLRSESGAPATQPTRRATGRVGRNEPCPCGSGKKFKKCCGARL